MASTMASCRSRCPSSQFSPCASVCYSSTGNSAISFQLPKPEEALSAFVLATRVKNTFIDGFTDDGEEDVVFAARRARRMHTLPARLSDSSVSETMECESTEAEESCEEGGRAVHGGAYYSAACEAADEVYGRYPPRCQAVQAVRLVLAAAGLPEWVRLPSLPPLHAQGTEAPQEEAAKGEDDTVSPAEAPAHGLQQRCAAMRAGLCCLVPVLP
eukprot:CAMPEP_0195061488 /NCGR_PEP_ID=MMETSP0448-20130528/8391_1 /TAXON_ID=66468 /ORGANISM="Heterocapsa triquestra, Strain CCMP 448" /LENGTH=213 /DNA_ID=CAMNT_0040092051 /DNA_START=84 /DNA_END=724 /DNA_ORIENTATION=+